MKQYIKQMENGKQLTLEECCPEIFPKQTYGVQDFLVKLFPLLENGEDLRIQEELSCMKYSGLQLKESPKYYSSKMLQDFLTMDLKTPSTNYQGKRLVQSSIQWGELGYNAEWQLLNTKNFGIPQHRQRVFIVGYLRGERRPEVLPIFGESTATLRELTSGKADADRIYDGSMSARTLKAEGGGGGAKTGLYAIPVLSPDRINKRQNGRRFKSNGDPMFTLTAQDRHGVMCYDLKEQSSSTRQSKPKGYANTLDKNCYQAVTVLNKSGNIKKSATTNQIASCLTAGGHSGGNHSDMDLLSFDGKSVRRLTPLECWRLQGFPDWAFYRAELAYSMAQKGKKKPLDEEYQRRLAWINEFQKNYDDIACFGIGAINAHRQWYLQNLVTVVCPDLQLYKQAGNGVSANVARAIGERFREYEIYGK